MSHNPKKKLINLINLTISRGKSIADKKLQRIMGGAEIQKIFDNKLKIAKDPHSKIFFSLSSNIF
tara:strand:- start:897 stop:1091 length:195 start_codon:yes stop_codon:yes gene_type:complete